MTRIISIFIIGVVAIGIPTFAHAQTSALPCDENNPVCSPACGSNQYCTYVGSGCQTECFANSTTDANGVTTVAPVTVTAKPTTTTTTGGSTFATIVNNLVAIVAGYVIPVLYAMAFLYFVLGLTRFVFADGEENRSKGRQVMMYGLIGLVVIFSVWGLVDVLLRTLTSFAGTQ